MSCKHLAILEAGRTILSPRISQKILCIFSVPNQACCVPDSPMKSQVLSTSQMDKNSRKLKSPSYQTPVQFRKEGCHPPPICTVSEMRMCENSHKQLTARLEAFLKGAVCCSGSCALVAIPLPNQNIFSLMSLF